jgi:hypothetical protein
LFRRRLVRRFTGSVAPFFHGLWRRPSSSARHRAPVIECRWSGISLLAVKPFVGPELGFPKQVVPAARWE